VDVFSSLFFWASKEKIFSCKLLESSSSSSWKRMYDFVFGTGIFESQIFVDLFANHLNHTQPLYATKGNSAFRYSWEKLLSNDSEYLWANPPFTQLGKVVTKLCMERTKVLLVHPDWVDQY
jgi:hypothetical protein